MMVRLRLFFYGWPRLKATMNATTLSCVYAYNAILQARGHPFQKFTLHHSLRIDDERNFLKRKLKYSTRAVLLHGLIVSILHLASPGYLFAYSEKRIAITVAIRNYFRHNQTLASARLMHPGSGWVKLKFGLNTTGGRTECIDGSESPEVECGALGPQPGHICVQVRLSIFGNPPRPVAYGVHFAFEKAKQRIQNTHTKAKGVAQPDFFFPSLCPSPFSLRLFFAFLFRVSVAENSLSASPPLGTSSLTMYSSSRAHGHVSITCQSFRQEQTCSLKWESTCCDRGAHSQSTLKESLHCFL